MCLALIFHRPDPIPFESFSTVVGAIRNNDNFAGQHKVSFKFSIAKPSMSEVVDISC